MSPALALYLVHTKCVVWLNIKDPAIYINSIDIAGRIVVGSLATSQILTHNARPFFSSHTHWTNTKQKHGATRENK